jgi:hypothetical protein
MSPDQARRMLDKFLARYGQPATLQRVAGSNVAVAASISLQARVEDLTAIELNGADGLQLGDSRVILSATPLIQGNWPVKNGSQVPVKGDRVIASGRTRTVLGPLQVRYINGELVRVELSIR